MKFLVTGALGFAGSHLVELLTKKRHEVFAPHVDLLNASETASALNGKSFDGVVHLAAIATTGSSFSSPGKILRNNILAQLHLLETLRKQSSRARILIICSADEYGKGANGVIDESTQLRPTSPYAVSKIAQDFMGLQYFLSYGMNIIRVRPFNHIGERQTLGFVVPDFVYQIVAIERSGKPGTMRVGSLSAVRDFTDVKDMVRAYLLAVTEGKPGDVYNIGSGKGVVIGDLLEHLTRLSKATVSVEIDPTRFRPGEEPRLVCDATKFKTLTGWKPTIALDETLARVLEYWRNEAET